MAVSEALNPWVLDKNRPIEHILVENGLPTIGRPAMIAAFETCRGPLKMRAFLYVAICVLGVMGCSDRSTKVEVPEPLVGDQLDTLLRELAGPIEIGDCSSAAIVLATNGNPADATRSYSYKVDELTCELKCDDETRRALMERLAAALLNRKGKWTSLTIRKNIDQTEVDVEGTHPHASAEIHFRTEPASENMFKLFMRSHERTL